VNSFSMARIRHSTRPINMDVMMSSFRLASRDLFNNYFHKLMVEKRENGNEKFPIHENFVKVQNILFDTLVLNPAMIGNISYGDLQPNIRVELRYGSHAPVLINRELRSGYWDHPIKEINDSANMLFMSFFDWNKDDFIDNQYVVAQIDNWFEYPSMKGKCVLIENRYVKFTLTQS